MPATSPWANPPHAEPPIEEVRAGDFVQLPETRTAMSTLGAVVTTDEVLSRVVHFLRLVRADASPVENTVFALRAIVYGHEMSVFAAVSADDQVVVRNLLFQAQDRVIDVTGGRLSEAAVQFGVGAAVGLLALGVVDTIAKRAEAVSRADHVILLANELDTLVRRRRIEACGDLLRKAVQIRRAELTSRDGADLQ